MIGQFFSPESHGSWTMIYRITATTPEDGTIHYDVMDERKARKLHSRLLERQLMGDGTTGVTVRVV
jgi:hypothetical protein|tara:strand:+ start:264 stop:461 length:198 start_codon:yes stop_codon:yes gene_type:complete